MNQNEWTVQLLSSGAGVHTSMHSLTSPGQAIHRGQGTAKLGSIRLSCLGEPGLIARISRPEEMAALEACNWSASSGLMRHSACSWTHVRPHVPTPNPTRTGRRT